MVNILEVGKMAFESYRKDIVAAVIYSLVRLTIGILSIVLIAVPVLVIGIAFIIPMLMIGAAIRAYIIPRILEWYYNKTIGNVKSNHELTFGIWLIRFLIQNLFSLLMFVMLLYVLLEETGTGSLFAGVLVSTLDSSSLIIIFLIVLILLIVIELIFYYQAYASILGKINKIEINSTIIKKSLILMFYVFVWSIILGIIMSIIIAVIRVISFIGGLLIGELLYLFVLEPILNLIIAHKALSM